MKENKVIYCEKCSGEITNRDDLVVTTNVFSVVPYHGKCFSRELKGLSGIVVGYTPINGIMGNLGAVLAAILGIAALFIKELRYISILSTLFLGIRLYSWFKYERHL